MGCSTISLNNEFGIIDNIIVRNNMYVMIYNFTTGTMNLADDAPYQNKPPALGVSLGLDVDRG